MTKRNFIKLMGTGALLPLVKLAHPAQAMNSQPAVTSLATQHPPLRRVNILRVDQTESALQMHLVNDQPMSAIKKGDFFNVVRVPGHPAEDTWLKATTDAFPHADAAGGNWAVQIEVIGKTIPIAAA